MEEDNNNDNTFRSVNNNKNFKKGGNFYRNVFVPFVSGIVGAGLVVGVCFGVPEIKSQLVDSNSSTSSSTTSTSTSATTVNTTSVSLEDYSDTAISVAAKVLPSIVGIEIEYSVSSMFGGSSTATASGSGIIISEDGYILTNNHVVSASSSSSSSSTYYQVSEATSIKVTLYNDDTVYEAEIVGTDDETDLAVIKIEEEGLTAAELGDSDSVQVGEFVMAVGNPLGLSSSVTCGIVSAVNRTITTTDNETYTVIQTDAAINSGNSGGALVNSEGQVIGINTAKLSGTGIEGIGFAIPINSTTDVVDQLITYNKVIRPYIGISGMTIDENTAQRYNLVVGVYIQSIEDFSAAQKAGLKAGDVIVEFDGETIETMDDLTEVKNEHSVGDTVTVKVYRDGEYKELEITLAEEP